MSSMTTVSMRILDLGQALFLAETNFDVPLNCYRIYRMLLRGYGVATLLCWLKHMPTFPTLQALSVRCDVMSWYGCQCVVLLHCFLKDACAINGILESWTLQVSPFNTRREFYFNTCSPCSRALWWSCRKIEMCYVFQPLLLPRVHINSNGVIRIRNSSKMIFRTSSSSASSLSNSNFAACAKSFAWSCTFVAMLTSNSVFAL